MFLDSVWLFGVVSGMSFQIVKIGLTLFSVTLGISGHLSAQINWSRQSIPPIQPGRLATPLPVWQQMGAVNPYHRNYAPSVLPVCGLYTPGPVAPFADHSTIRNHRQRQSPVGGCPRHFLSRAPFHPTPNGGIQPSLNVAADHAWPAADPLKDAYFDGHLIDVPTIQYSVPRSVLSQTDEVEGEISSVILSSPVEADNNQPQDDELQGDKPQDDELARLLRELKLAKRKNAALVEQLEQAKAALELSLAADDAIQREQLGTERNIQKRIQEAVKQADHNAAAQIARLQKEAARNKKLFQRQKEELLSSRNELLARLRALESKLKPAPSSDDSHDVHDDDKMTPPPPQQVGLTLAELAEFKRQQRRQNEAAKADSLSERQSLAPGEQEPSSVQEELEEQIALSLSKVERRFAKKIDTLKNEQASIQEIQQLQNEMSIQKQKLEERIRERFRNRLEK